MIRKDINAFSRQTVSLADDYAHLLSFLAYDLEDFAMLKSRIVCSECAVFGRKFRSCRSYPDSWNSLM